MQRKVLFLTVLVLALILLRPGLGRAEGLVWNGSMEVKESYYGLKEPNTAIPPEMAFSTRLQLKMEMNSGEKQSSVVMLQYQTQDPGKESSVNPGQQSPDFNLSLQQAYVDLLLPRNAFLRAGRQKIAWGTGFAWNPTNYIGAGKNRADLAAEKPGVDALNVEVNSGRYSGTVVLKPGDHWGEGAAAAKLGFQVLHGDLSLSVYKGQDEFGSKRAVGGDFATTLGDYVLYGEAAWQAGNRRAYVTNAGEVQERPDQGYFHGVAGVYRNFASNTFLLLEYYHSQEGWNDQEVENYYKLLAAPLITPEVTALLQTEIGDLRQNYLFFLARKPELIDSLTVGGSVLWNLDDQSYMLTPEIRYDLGQSACLLLNGNLFRGERTTEFGSLPFRSQVNAGIVVNF
ncbi:MAG: hypothetical protein ACM3TT_05995 [Syntrophothermus sp.]